MPNSTEVISFTYGDALIRINRQDLVAAGVIFRAIHHDIRARILNLLSEEEELTVTDIHQKLGIEQTIISQQLTVLRRAGLVVTRREGRYMYYRLEKKGLAEVARSLSHLIYR